MVAAQLYGGLGNQMFQQAAAIGYAKEHGNRFYQNELNPNIPTLHVKETGHNHNLIPNFGNKENVLLDGYFQSEKYFDGAKDEVRRYFSAPTEFEKGVCSIHIRRGDYLLYPTKHPVVTVEYIWKAILEINTRTNCSYFKVFSDDIIWCKRSFSDNGYFMEDTTFTFMPRQVNARLDMCAMMRCEHNIIANSTFSWWGAWLNPNPDKIVISPSKENWFGPGNAHLDTSDIIPEKWIQIKY